MCVASSDEASLDERARSRSQGRQAPRSGDRSAATRLDGGEHTRTLSALDGASLPQHLVVDGERETRAFLRSPTDSQWLAMLARYGLVRPSFVAPPRLEELRRLTRPARPDTPGGLDAAQHAAPDAGRERPAHRRHPDGPCSVCRAATCWTVWWRARTPNRWWRGARATRARRSRRYWTRWGAGWTRAPSRWSRCCATCRRRSSGRWRTWSGALSRRPEQDYELPWTLLQTLPGRRAASPVAACTARTARHACAPRHGRAKG